jgi:hypothetical protein
LPIDNKQLDGIETNFRAAYKKLSLRVNHSGRIARFSRHTNPPMER